MYVHVGRPAARAASIDTVPRGHARLSRRAAPAGDRGAPPQGAAACACSPGPRGRAL
jgi:hypothetical protein